MKTAFLFPGQGAQYPGMARDLFDQSSEVKKLFQLASDTSGIDVKRLLFEGTEDELKETVNTQISITLANLSSRTVLNERGMVAQGCAGFSLGEYAALVDSGVLTAEQVFPLVKFRGESMAKAASALDRSAGAPGMAAVMGLSPETIEEVIARAQIPDLYGANFNSPVQTVISGTAAALKAAEEAFKAAGAKRIIPLKVSGPFHSPLLIQAAQDLEGYLKTLSFQNPAKDLFSNVTGKKILSGKEAQELAVKQVTAPVRWTTEEATLVAEGYQRVIECGPGTVLAGLWKAFNPENPCLGAGKLEQINEIPS